MGLYDNAWPHVYEEIRRFYPVWYRDVLEMDAIWRAQGAELDGVRSTIERIVFNGYINTADAETIAKYEKFLEITPELNATLEERRAQVAAIMFPSPHIGAPEIREIFAFFAKGRICVRLVGGFVELVVDLKENEVLSAPAFLRALDRKFPAHLRIGIVFETQVGICVKTKARGFKYRSPATGVPLTGTFPQRNTVAGLTNDSITLDAEAKNYPYASHRAGTKPQRNTPAGIERNRFQLQSTARGFFYDVMASGVVETGTTPNRATSGKITEQDIQVDAAARGFSYAAPLTGTLDAGEAPRRSTPAKIFQDQVGVTADARGFSYVTHATGEADVGTTPKRETGARAQSGAFFAVAEAESFRYTVKLCGTSYCKS